MASTNQTSRAGRHRATVACENCRRRKVRCSLSVTGVPCAGCTQDGTRCIVNTKRKKATRQLDRLTPRYLRQSPSGAFDSNSIPNISQTSSLGRAADSTDIPTFRIHSEQAITNVAGTDSDRGLNSIEDEERNGLEIATAALGQPGRSGEVSFYAGEQTGPTSTLDICSPQSLPKHFLLPFHRTHLSDEDRAFLRIKGVFTFPGKDTCNSLIEAYLLYVHPILPVVEADVLLNHHKIGQLQEYNILLLWSLFFVAANFVPAHVYEKEGYASKRELKFAMYSRAKCMFNNGNERNKIVLLQSSLLLGFWHSDLEEHSQPWYWIGIAITLCQILGLHRDPEISKYNPVITNRQRCFWRRLWWSCFFRDRWLSLTLGRPLRINLDDCDTPMPLVGDMLFDIDGLEPALISHLPSDMQRLADYWVNLIELTCQLGKVLIMNYRTSRPIPSLREVESLEKQLLESRLPDQYEGGLARSSRFYSNHVHLHYQAMLITFYRPWGTGSPNELSPTAEKDWQNGMRLKADAAASRTNEILDALVQHKLLGFAGPMTPPLLVPAMQTHLLQCKIGDSLSKRIRLNKLEICMLVMEELQKTYTVASIYRGIFTKAIQVLFPGYLAHVTLNNAPADDAAGFDTESRHENIVAAGEDSDHIPQSSDAAFDGADEGYLVDALMDEASIFSLWESWNQI